MKHSVSERAALQAALSRLSLEIDEKQENQLLQHCKLVLEKNKVVNLTAIESIQEAIELHIEDSLSAVQVIDDVEGRFCDIGTGAGFPGIPLAIVSGKQGTLIESIQKKAQAVQEFVIALDLVDQVDVYAGRSEDLAKKRRNNYSCVVSRAVSSINAVQELASPLLSVGGLLVLFRSSNSEDEEKMSQNGTQRLGFELNAEVFTSIGSLGKQRKLLVYEKVQEAEIELPRRNGMAQKRPLR